VKLLEGYVKNRTKEAALAAVLFALAIVARYLVIPLFIPPIHGLSCSVIFYTISVLVLSYPYILILSFLLSMTSNSSFLVFPVFVVSFTIFFFLSKLMGLKRVKYYTFFSSPLNSLVYLTINPLIGSPLGPLCWQTHLIPLMTLSSAQGVLAVIVVPYIIKIMEKFSIIEEVK